MEPRGARAAGARSDLVLASAAALAAAALASCAAFLPRAQVGIMSTHSV